MPKPDFTLKFVKDAASLQRLAEILVSLPAFAVDIETTDWWNRHHERIALLQIAYRAAAQVRVVIVDALADFDLAPLRLPLEQSSALKIIHNAGFDATRLEKHYGFAVAPVFDTMLAARRSKEKKYSLQAQAEIYLGLRLDKAAQTSDWSRRPLDVRQLHYAALDPYATLLLYENQKGRNLTGAYRSRSVVDHAQSLLPLDQLPPSPVESRAAQVSSVITETVTPPALTEEAVALLGIITELPNYYSLDALAASVGVGRVGLAGWIIDQRLGTDSEPDEATVKLAIADLCENKLVRLTDTRRLEATETGAQLWQSVNKGDS